MTRLKGKFRWLNFSEWVGAQLSRFLETLPKDKGALTDAISYLQLKLHGVQEEAQCYTS